MPIIHMEPATEEEIANYRKQKHEEYIKSFSDPEKQNPMKIKAKVTVGKVTCGLCPKCNHCLILGDTVCDECFQRIDWSE